MKCPTACASLGRSMESNLRLGMQALCFERVQRGEFFLASDGAYARSGGRRDVISAAPSGHLTQEGSVFSAAGMRGPAHQFMFRVLSAGGTLVLAYQKISERHS